MRFAAGPVSGGRPRCSLTPSQRGSSRTGTLTGSASSVDMWHGWAFPPAWAGAFNEIITRHQGLIGFHNSPYDWQVLAVHQGIEPAWAQTEDTNLLCRLEDSSMKADLKGQATRRIDRYAARAQQELKAGMKRKRVDLGHGAGYLGALLAVRRAGPGAHRAPVEHALTDAPALSPGV